MRRAQGSLLAAAMASVLGGAAAHAQSCTAESAAVTRCRLVLSEPRSFRVEAGARFARAYPSGATLVVAIDGQPRRAWRSFLGDRVLARSWITLSPGEHVVVAHLVSGSSTSLGVGVRLDPSPRLAELPREGAALNPPERSRKLWFFRPSR